MDLRGIMVLIGMGIVRIGVVSVTVSPEMAVDPPSPSRRVSPGPSPQQLPARRRGFLATAVLGTPGVQLGFVFGEAAAGLAWY